MDNRIDFDKVLTVLGEISAAPFKDYLVFHKHRFNFLFDQLAVGFEPGRKLLDIGSFSGFMILGAKLMGYDVSGTDLSKYTQAISEVCVKFGMDNRPADLAKDVLPFADDSFDVVLFSEVLEHFNFHPLIVFQEIARVLKKGGRLIVTTPNLNRLNNVLKLVTGQSVNNDITLAYYEGTHYREYTKKEIFFLSEQVGLKPLKCDFVNFKYPSSGISAAVSDFLTETIFRTKKKDLVIVAQK